MDPYTGAASAPALCTHDVLTVSGFYLWWPRGGSRSPVICAVTVLDVRLARPRPRLQLAKPSGSGVRRSSSCSRSPAPSVLPVGERPAYRYRQRAAAGGRCRRARALRPAVGSPGPEGRAPPLARRRAAARPRRTLCASRRPDGGLVDPNAAGCPSGRAVRCCLHPGAARPGIRARVVLTLAPPPRRSCGGSRSPPPSRAASCGARPRPPHRLRWGASSASSSPAWRRGGSVLVYTGVALAWRRYRAWSVRGRRVAPGPERTDTGIASTS